MNPETRYWIQEQATNGSYFNSVGLPLTMPLEDAIIRAADYQRAWPNNPVRLAAVVTVPILNPQPKRQDNQ